MVPESANDPKVMVLPHPIRLEAASGEPMDTLLFERAGVMEGLRPYLTDETATTERIINEVPGMQPLAIKLFGAYASGNLGSFVLILMRARLRAYGDPIFQVTLALQEMLAETELGFDLPVRFFRPPHPLVYIEFARPNPLQVHNKQSGLHECEGVYISSHDIPAHHEMLCNPVRNEVLKLDPSKPARMVEIVVTGSPVGKQHALDDASQDVMLLFQDEEECLRTVLERHIEFFKSPHSWSQVGLAPLSQIEADTITPVIYQLAKVLLYIALPEARQRNYPERTEQEHRLSQLGPKKAAKLRRQQGHAYDRILIGPDYVEEPQSDTDAATGDATNGVRPHWRRGHFRRIRFGEGLREVRVGWIPPTLVKAEALQGEAQKKGSSHIPSR
ncbi:hypothetical protein [Halorhodospira abdelmalekii]|uniref:hypothetical protein n=1 Tax=Halorhodospira abdelmalekii TaxID=421629 RepID=UPI0019063831|nr:hypothetical protein [Halorhodospira abdelmalekii]